MNGWQGIPRSEELGGKYDLGSKGFAFSCTISEQQESTQLFQHRKIGYYEYYKLCCRRRRIVQYGSPFSLNGNSLQDERQVL